MKKIKGIKIQFIPFSKIENLSSYKRVKFLLDNIKENKIIILQGKLSHDEEADLIEETMVNIGKRKNFKGIEIATLAPKPEDNIFGKLRKKLADALVGDRDMITIIGPATIVREIKKDISKLELYLKI
ncbi:MAG: DUF2073 domain-containing protein [Candidatus Pacearchaeota archaeon]